MSLNAPLFYIIIIPIEGEMLYNPRQNKTKSLAICAQGSLLP
jgi:hypothetical protein